MFCTVHRILNVNSWGYEKVGSFGLDLRLDRTGVSCRLHDAKGFDTLTNMATD